MEVSEIKCLGHRFSYSDTPSCVASCLELFVSTYARLTIDIWLTQATAPRDTIIEIVCGLAGTLVTIIIGYLTLRAMNKDSLESNTLSPVQIFTDTVPKDCWLKVNAREADYLNITFE